MNDFLRKGAMAACLLLGVTASAHAQSATDLLPTGGGDRWTYLTQGPNDHGRRIEARVARTSNGWALVDGPLGQRWLYAARTTGTVRAFDPAAGRSGVVFDLALPVLRKMDVDLPGGGCMDGTGWAVAERNAQVRTPLGVHQGCVVLERVRAVCPTSGLVRLVFAPGLGIVQYAWATSVGAQSAVLVAAEVGGRRFDAPFVDRLAARDPSLWYYFGADRATLRRVPDRDVLTGLRVDPNEATLRRIARVRAMIWDDLTYRLDANGQLPVDSAGAWLVGRVVDPADNQAYDVVHWADIDDNSWSVYFVGDEVVSVYYEN